MPLLPGNAEPIARKILKERGFAFARKFERCDPERRWWIALPGYSSLSTYLNSPNLLDAYNYLTRHLNYSTTGLGTTKDIQTRTDKFEEFDMPDANTT